MSLVTFLQSCAANETNFLNLTALNQRNDSLQEYQLTSKPVVRSKSGELRLTYDLALGEFQRSPSK